MSKHVEQVDVWPNRRDRFSSYYCAVGTLAAIGVMSGLITVSARAADRVVVASIGTGSSTVTDRINVPVRKPKYTGPVRQPVRGQLQIVISIPDQRMDVFDGVRRIASTRVSTGKRGHATPKGVFSVIQKNRRHFSNIYNNAPMPFMQRLTWSGIALHAGNVPRYPASHGCIRMPYGFAQKLFGLTSRRAQIVVNRSRQKPRYIEHDNLFHPKPRPKVNVAQKIANLTLDGLHARDLIGRDAVVLNNKKAEAFAKALFETFHPNSGARERAFTRVAQRMLLQLGYDVGPPDGDLGRQTRRTLVQFQKIQGIKTTGKPDRRTIRRLYRSLGERMITMDADAADALLIPDQTNAPLRILITRQKPHDNAKRAQQMMETLGYDVGYPDGVIGRKTRKAIEQFREKFDLPGPSSVDDGLMQALSTASGTQLGDGFNGRLLIRQGYRDIYEAPIRIEDPDNPLGTHVYTSMNFGNDRNARAIWTALSVDEQTKRQRRKRKKNRRKRRRGDRVASLDQSIVPKLETSAEAALSRIEIPQDVRTYIEQALMPGSSVIVTDRGNSHETGEGTDFIVLTK